MRTLLAGAADEVVKDKPAVRDMLAQLRAVAAKH
jgi:hypothetical protein